MRTPKGLYAEARTIYQTELESCPIFGGHQAEVPKLGLAEDDSNADGSGMDILGKVTR